jgi:succinate dehydrogenase / fumarate reductase, cytochrome b subunit
MQINLAPPLGRHEFLLRRLHSLVGLVPVGGYLIFHLATNASILDGVQTFQYRVSQISDLGPTTITILEWLLIFIPILFHAAIGTLIVLRGKRNLARYPYAGNFRYTWQRWTGVVALAFILWHVFQMHGWFRWEWWAQHVAVPWGGKQFDYTNAITAAEVIQRPWVAVLYFIGVSACLYHFVNGLWTMGLTWGVWTSLRAQRLANIPVVIVGLAVAIIGYGALVGMLIAPVPDPPRTPAPRNLQGERSVPAPAELPQPGEHQQQRSAVAGLEESKGSA